MAQLFNMPQLGSTMEEGLVVLWKRGEGETIRKGEILLEVETDKTIVEVPAPCDGVLHKILASPETRVPIHRPIAILGHPQEDIMPLLAGLESDSAEGVAPSAASDTANATAAATRVDAKSDELDFAVSPRARRLADERGVPLALLAGRGTGPGNRVIERDVMAYLASEPANTAETRSQAGDVPIEDLGELTLGLPGSQIRPLPAPLSSSPVRSALQHATAVSTHPASQPCEAVPTATMTLEVDMTACLALQAQLMAAVNAQYRAVLDCVHITIKATAQALQTVPQLNAVTADPGFVAPVNIDIAVLTPVENDVVTQIVENANSLTLGAVSATLTGFTGHQSEETRVAKGQRTFTVVVLTDEIDRFHPALPAGHEAALGLGRVAQRPVAVNRQIVVRTTMHLCLTYAATAVDTALAVRFLRRLKELLEAPAQILI